MARLDTIVIDRLIAAILVVSVSICCCHTHFLVDGLSGPGDTPAAATACCPGCAESCPDQPDQGPEAPTKKCRTCCIKGTGLKDLTPLFMPITAIPMPAPVAHAVLIAPAASPVSMPIDSARHRPEPSTLLRLHCALIV